LSQMRQCTRQCLRRSKPGSHPQVLETLNGGARPELHRPRRRCCRHSRGRQRVRAQP
jgi:hypothetical protein